MLRRSLIVSAASAPFLARTARAQVSGRVAVLTSFGKDVTDPFKAAFERAHPGLRLEV